MQQQYEAWPDVKTPSACRFASNHFTSATDLVIELTLSFKFMRQSTTIGNFPEAVVTAISPKVWNQLCAWRTELTQTGKNLPANLLLITQTCYEKIEAGFLAAKYAIGPGNSSTKTAILERLKTCTAVAACTHGAQTGVDASKGPAQYMDWYTIVGKVQENGDRYLVPVVAAAYPPMSVLLLYACHTLPGSPFPPDTFFKLWRLPLADFEPQLNSFGGGFDQTLLIADASAGLAGWDNIYKHPEAMFLKLSEGFPIKKALDYANATFPPIYFDGADLLTTPMTGAFGDNMATTKYVYLTAAERIALSTAVPPPSAWEIPDLGWYKIPPPQ